MIKNISKEVILQASLQKQEELINNFDNRVSEMRSDANSQNQSASQSEDRLAGNVEVLSTLESELAFVQMEIGQLKTLNASHVSNEVEPGAVVVTNQRIFFIAISSEKIEIDGHVIYGISTNAPIMATTKVEEVPRPEPAGASTNVDSLKPVNGIPKSL